MGQSGKQGWTVFGKLDRYITLHTKMNSKWIGDLDVGPETTELLEENRGSKPSDVTLGNSSLSKENKRKDKQMELY